MLKKHMEPDKPQKKPCITGNAANLRMYQDSEAIQLKSFYHGRSETRQEVADNDMTLTDMHSRQSLDFDPAGRGGIYFAHAYSISRNWAMSQAERCRIDCLQQLRLSKPWVIPVVYTYEVPDGELGTLNSKTWGTVLNRNSIDFSSDEERKDWQKFVLRSRTNVNQHEYEMVTGPMMSNPTVALSIVRAQKNTEGFDLDRTATESVHWKEEADQTAIYSEHAKGLFQGHCTHRDIIPFEDPAFDDFEKIHTNLTGQKTRPQISLFRLDNPTLEQTPIMRKYVESLRKSIIEHFINNLEPLPEHKAVFVECLKQYKLLGELNDTYFSMKILEIEKELQVNQEYKQSSDFEDYLMKAADFRCLAELLNSNAAPLIEQLKMPFLSTAFTFTNKDFATAYQITKIVESYGIKYIKDLSDVPLDAPLGSGRKKDAYRLKDGTVMVKMKSFDFFNALSREIGMIDLLKHLKLPVVDILGITLHNHMPAMIMPYMPEQSKDFKAEQAPQTGSASSSSGSVLKVSDKIIKLPTSMNPGSLKQLVCIQKKLQAEQIHVSDLQFLIGEQGEIVIADPRKVDLDSPPSEGNIGTINHTLAAGVVSIGKLNSASPIDYQSLSKRIESLTTLDDQTQIYHIIKILMKKYQIQVTGQITEPPEEIVPAPPKQKKEQTKADTVKKIKPSPVAPDAEKKIILDKLDASKDTREYLGKQRKFILIKDSRDACYINGLFGLTTASFFNAYLVLKRENRVYADEQGLYLLDP